MTKQTSIRRTANTLCLVAGLVAVAAWPEVASAASTINGTITFDGKAPTLKPLEMSAEAACGTMDEKAAAN